MHHYLAHLISDMHLAAGRVPLSRIAPDEFEAKGTSFRILQSRTRSIARLARSFANAKILTLIRLNLTRDKPTNCHFKTSFIT